MSMAIDLIYGAVTLTTVVPGRLINAAINHKCVQNIQVVLAIVLFVRFERLH